ncbi:hypothetical protein H9L05_14015 [Hymenobacter qilianensis]|uniref:Lipopolysaccharide biosynthesis protein n=1 Tax=Hymenobacter qilianensis TaxID=1385715 RepID=A0A7H0GSD3_9BACT|nr:hypothetical protein [Hymenobacter qilianensis]QNP51199.1 hypothetical protein H9L05_14015 [Hymenobacter qilianensis]
MSTVKRFLSASAASWARVGVTVVAQIALVPLYLTHWDVELYGIWLATHALASLLFTLDLGHQEFLGYEFMRIGKHSCSKLSRYLWSGIVFSIGINLFQLLLISFFLITGVISDLLGSSSILAPGIIRMVGIILIAQGIAWLIGTSISGLLFRVLAPFGYYPRMAWWNFIDAIISALTPLVAVSLGADLLTTGVVTAVVTVIFSIPKYCDLVRLMRKENIPFSYPSWQVGYANFLLSLAVFGKISLENIRQQGVRIVLAPLVGVGGLAAFSTMRTGSNIALQGLNTITNPLIPDLMRFLQQRDQARCESVFGAVWIIVVALMAPAVVVLQAVIEPVYLVWTRGHIAFNPWLFALLSLSVLVFAVVQPATTIVVGNNLLKPQLLLSTLAALSVVGGIYLFVPRIGIVGAGIALLGLK